MLLKEARLGLADESCAAPMHATVKTVVGVAGLRDLAAGDLPDIVEYWTRSPEDFLAAMGVDRERLGTEAQIQARFEKAIRTGDANQPHIALAITLEGRLIGYTLLNRYSEDVNYSHWHIIQTGLRTKGISTALYPHRVKAYFDLAPIARLIHQTRTSNLGMNRVLDRFIPISETRYIETPDGVAAPGEFHLRYVRREDIPALFARAAELRAGQRVR